MSFAAVGTATLLARAVLDGLKVTLKFPVGDGFLILPPFPLAGSGVVVDEFVAEGFAGEGAFAEEPGGFQ